MPTRRDLLKAASIGIAVAGMGLGLGWKRSAAEAPVKTFVLAHGSWHGGWCWRRVADRLRRLGHAVYTPSYTGLGDRSHLLNKEITLDTWIEDLIGVIQSEELINVVLVGHSFGGVTISGTADRISERIAHLVYLDGLILESGKHSYSYLPPAVAEARIAAAARATNGLAIPVPDPLPAFWGLKEGTPDYDWVRRRLSPNPLRTSITPLILRGPVGNGLPRTYVHCTRPSHPKLGDSRQLVRSWSGWNWIDLAAPHDAMITNPDDVVNILLRV